MSRTKKFVLSVDASEQFLAHAPEALQWVRDMLHEQSRRVLIGPRGGHYLAVNLPHDFRESVNFSSYTRTFTARVTGRYVRPRRDNAGAGTDQE